MRGWEPGSQCKEETACSRDVCLRRMLRVASAERLSNEMVLQITGVIRELLGAVRNRWLKFLGHLIRHD